MKTPDLDLDLLRCFLAVAESGGFTAAAKRLNLSQSAISLKIQRLEAMLGHEVFIRTSRSLTLTREGDTVLGYARRLLDLSQEMIHLVAQPAVEGVLRLGVLQQFEQQILPDLLSRFKERHPKICQTVEVGMTADLLKALEEDRLDIVLGAAGHTSSMGTKFGAFHEADVLLREPMVWVQSARSAIDPTRTPIPLVVFAAPCGFRRTALHLLEKVGRLWRIAYSGTSLASIQSAVIADLGISILGKSSVLPGMKIVGAREGLPALPNLSIAIYSCKSADESLVRSLSTFIAAAISEPGKRATVKGRRRSSKVRSR